MTCLVTMEEIVKALKECYDPEIPVNVWDLGLIYDVNVDGEKVHVKMTLTAPACPVAAMLVAEVDDKIRRLPGVDRHYFEGLFDGHVAFVRIAVERRAAGQLKGNAIEETQVRDPWPSSLLTHARTSPGHR